MNLAATTSFLIATSPVWMTIGLTILFFHTWFSYKRRKFINEKGGVLLEIRLPKDIQKTPAAMEMVLESMWEDVAGSMTDIFIDGAVRNWFSLEIV